MGEGRTSERADEGNAWHRLLRYHKAFAAVLGDDPTVIILQPDATKIEVLEGFLHGTQARLGMLDRLSRREIKFHVKDFMIRHRKLLGICDEDVEILKIHRERYR